MGNNFVQSNLNEGTKDHLLNISNFNFRGMFKDDRLGDINELEYIPTKETVFLKELTLKNVQSLSEQHINALHKRCQLRHPNLLLIIGFTYSSIYLDGQKNIKINLYFEPYKTDLADDMYKRQKMNLCYAEHELLALMDCLVSVLVMLQTNDIAHGNICPQNILINDNDLVKIADNCMFNCEYSQYYQALSSRIKSNYLAPELMELLAKDQKEIDIFNDYRYKSDVFALGMIFLEMVLLDSNNTCYDWNSLTFSKKNLNARLDRAKLKYSKVLLNLISHMLSLNPYTRPDFIELKSEVENSKKVGNLLKYVSPSPSLSESCLKSSESPISLFPNPFSRLPTPVFTLPLPLHHHTLPSLFETPVGMVGAWEVDCQEGLRLTARRSVD